jgi:predicted molibdopterin-dependent oxidoreductase YjgC
MLKPIEVPDGSRPRCVTIRVDGRDLLVAEGQTLATALLAADVVPFRHTPVSGAPRAPFCLMGACFECLVEVDDRPNVQACMVDVRDGMRVRRQRGARDAGAPA